MNQIHSTATPDAPTSGVHDELPDFLMPFAAMHDAMRRDSARLERAVADVDRSVDAPALHRWWQRFAAVIVHHHHREDEVVWPALLDRVPSFTAVHTQLGEDHVELDRVMVDVGAAIAAMAAGSDAEPTRRPACDAAAALRTLLVDHLDREESIAFPLIAESFTSEEYAAIEREIRKGSTLRAAAFELPWVLDLAEPRCRAVIDGMVPGVMRVAMRLRWQRSYDRISMPVR